MSIKIMSWVLDHSPYLGKQRLIHLVLADHANDEGLCWPSQETIARRAGCSVEYVRTTVTSMVTDGYLVRERESAGRGKPTHYRVVPKSVGGSSENPQVQQGNPQLSRPKPPNPSPNNHQEPSKNLSSSIEKVQCPYCKRKFVWGKPHDCSAMNMRMR